MDKFHIKCYYCKNDLDKSRMHGNMFVEVDGERVLVSYHYHCEWEATHEKTLNYPRTDTGD